MMIVCSSMQYVLLFDLRVKQTTGNNSNSNSNRLYRCVRQRTKQKYAQCYTKRFCVRFDKCVMDCVPSVAAAFKRTKAVTNYSAWLKIARNKRSKRKSDGGGIDNDGRTEIECYWVLRFENIRSSFWLLFFLHVLNVDLWMKIQSVLRARAVHRRKLLQIVVHFDSLRCASHPNNPPVIKQYQHTHTATHAYRYKCARAIFPLWLIDSQLQYACNRNCYELYRNSECGSFYRLCTMWRSEVIESTNFRRSRSGRIFDSVIKFTWKWNILYVYKYL